MRANILIRLIYGVLPRNMFMMSVHWLFKVMIMVPVIIWDIVIRKARLHSTKCMCVCVWVDVAMGPVRFRFGLVWFGFLALKPNQTIYLY